jgi:hypothetical protein
MVLFKIEHFSNLFFNAPPLIGGASNAVICCRMMTGLSLQARGVALSHNRRTALQIAAQLPPERADAFAVLAYAHEIVEKFFQPSATEAKIPKLRAISGPDSKPK